MTESEGKNVVGGPLALCCAEPCTGFYRDGYCRTGVQDVGLHIVCAEVTEEFLEYSMMVGNDLSTPRPEFDFPGLQQGDRWCLCGMRWVQALEAGKAPKIVLNATHEKMLELVPIETLVKFGLDVA